MIARRITYYAATVAAVGAISAATLGLAASANAAPATVTYNPVMDPAPSPVEGRQPVMAGAPATVSCCSWEPGVVSNSAPATVTYNPVMSEAPAVDAPSAHVGAPTVKGPTSPHHGK